MIRGHRFIRAHPDRLGQVWIQTDEGLYCYKVTDKELAKVAGDWRNYPFTGPGSH